MLNELVTESEYKCIYPNPNCACAECIQNRHTRVRQTHPLLIKSQENEEHDWFATFLSQKETDEDLEALETACDINVAEWTYRKKLTTEKRSQLCLERAAVV